MGNKVHPGGLRLGVTKDHSSRWFAEGPRYKELLKEDYQIRQYVYNNLRGASISDIDIERKADQIALSIHTARPGVVVGRGGSGIEALQKGLQKQLKVPSQDIRINVVEVRRVDADASLVADYIAQQLERRVSFRRVIQQVLRRAQGADVEGIKIQISGRLNGAEIARTEWTREGKVPLHTLRANIDYAYGIAKTTYGVLGIKVWIFKGEVTSSKENLWTPKKILENKGKKEEHSLRDKPIYSTVEHTDNSIREKEKPNQYTRSSNKTPKPTEKQPREQEPPSIPPKPPKGEHDEGFSLPRIYIHAEMDEQVILHHAVTLEVTLSREMQEWLEGPTAKTSAVEIEEEKTLLIQVIPKSNFSVIGEERAEIDIPQHNENKTLYFDLRGTDLGKGEVWVVARQGPHSLATLKIKPEILATREEIRSSNKTSKNSPISASPDTDISINHLIIIEQENGGRISYNYEFLSDSLNICAYGKSGEIAVNRSKYIEKIYQDIESRWSNNINDQESFSYDLRAFGGELFDQLFPEVIRRLLWENRNQLESILVISTEPFIPWELVSC